MGKITILHHTTKEPLALIGEMAGICWGANTDNKAKNIKRAWDCINHGHMRTTEFPDVYMSIDGYSARVLRELYTHIGGMPTRLQASTRYIDYEHGFNYITPSTIEKNNQALKIYEEAMAQCAEALYRLDEIGIPREDSANLLPLGMTSKMVYKINLRTLIDMSHQRECTRAYWEFRELFNDIKKELSNYSSEWEEIIKHCFMPKCEVYGYCPEGKKETCGRMPLKLTN